MAEFEFDKIKDGSVEVPVITHVMMTPVDCEFPVSTQLGDLKPLLFKTICDYVTMNMIASYKKQGGDIDALLELEGD